MLAAPVHVQSSHASGQVVVRKGQLQHQQQHHSSKQVMTNS